MKLPQANNSIEARIDAHHEGHAEPPRPHMGASQLGHPCDRWLWLSFRWAVQPRFPGRILRLFRRGSLEEASIISDLRAIGLDVRASGPELTIRDWGHVGGTLDAIIESGVPEAPKKRHVAEFKTHSRKSFETLTQKGVEAAKPEHFVQMQLYMHGTGIDRALYVAVCKDDDRLYTERVRYDKDVAEKYLQRGQRLALDDRLPPPISTDPSWYQCKFCSAHAFCHKTQLTEHVNCRTCAHVTAKPDGTWRCELHEADDIPVEFQREGCESHVLHPDLVPWERQDCESPWEAVYVIDGVPVRNGHGDLNTYTSREILANATACATADHGIKTIRERFNARIER